MALILKDRVQETSTTTGTGTLTLAGAVTQFQTFSSAVGNGNTTYYTIYNAGGTQWEVGLGTVGAGTLSRDTVLASSNANALVSFTGTLYVFGDYPAGKSVYLDAIGTATVSQLATSSTTNTTPVLSYNASNSNYAAGATVSGTYLQTVMQNKSGTAGASTNYVLSNDLGTDSTYYGEFGMNSSVYSSGTPADFFSLNNGIYFSGHDGPITVGSGNGQKLYLAWGTTGQSAHVINTTGAIGLNTNITGTTNFGTSGQVLTSAGSAATPTWTTPTTGTVTSVAASAGTGISVSGSPITSSGTLTITNTAPDQTVVLTAGTGISTSGTYPNFTITNTAPSSGGTVTSVAATVPSFLSVSGSPITSSGTLALTYSGIALPAANGGTGLTSPGSSGNVLTSNGTAWVSSALSGSGDVVGPSSATNTGIALFDGTTGKLLKDSATTDGLINGLTVGKGGSSKSANTAFGVSVLSANSTGNANTGVGISSLGSNTSGNNNTAFGYQSLASNVNGSQNTALGHNALVSADTASFNVACGRGALQSVSSGSGNTALNPLTSTGTYSPVFDPGTESNRFCMGSTGVTNAYIQVSWTVVSDVRDKTDFAKVPHGLDFITQIEPTAYRYKINRDTQEGHGPLRYGFKAQQVLEIEKASSSAVIVDDEDENKLRFNDQSLLAVMVNAIKELNAKLESQAIEIAALKGK